MAQRLRVSYADAARIAPAAPLASARAVVSEADDSEEDSEDVVLPFGAKPIAVVPTGLLPDAVKKFSMILIAEAPLCFVYSDIQSTVDQSPLLIQFLSKTCTHGTISSARCPVRDREFLPNVDLQFDDLRCPRKPR